MIEHTSQNPSGPVTHERKLIAGARGQAEEAAQREAAATQTADSPGSGAFAPFPAGDSLPGYEILREIHRGGQGVVYQAIQKSTQRKVAIKVLHEGPFAGPRSRVRFEREVQILGALNHPNIVTIHDSGRAAGDALYYVMDYVRGHGLRDFVREKRLALEPGLEFFATVCEAVQHAHTRGIIHRDLKPGNILVDAEGRPIVVDFGFGKLLGGAADAVSVTQDVMGTLAYMSPEQTRGNPDEIDTRTDVYSLGVILYELLTGNHPYTTMGPMPDIVREIRETEPTPPSRRWSSDSGITTRATRRLSAGRCPIDDEVQTIVLRCLAKERDRRYQSAGEIARDIRHYLAGEPIEAKRDSHGYLLRKQLRKYKLHASVAMALLIMLPGFAVAMSAYAARNHELYVAAERARQKEQSERKRADREAADADRTADFMTDMLKGVDASVALGRDTTLLRELMDGAARRIARGELTDAPEAELRLRLAIGDTYRELAAYEPAAEMLIPATPLAQTLASGGDSTQLGHSLAARAELLRQTGHADESEPMYQQALEVSQRLYDGDHPDSAAALAGLAIARIDLGRAADAEPLFQEALEMLQRIHNGDHPDVVKALSNLASARQHLGHRTEAASLYKSAVEMTQRLSLGDHPDTLLALNNLSHVLWSLGRPADAERFAVQALEMSRALYKNDHPNVATCLNTLGLIREDLGRAADAELLFQESLAMRRRLHLGDHPDLAVALSNYALVLQTLGRADAAEPFQREALEMSQRLHSGDHPAVAVGLGNLGSVLEKLGRSEDAAQLYQESLEMYKRLYPGDHPDTAKCLYKIARLEHVQGRPRDAEPVYVQALEMYERLSDADHPELMMTLNNLAVARRELGRPAEGEPLLRQALEMNRRMYSGDHLEIARSLRNLAVLLADQGSLSEAEPLFREAFEMRKRLFGDEHLDTVNSMANLGHVLWDEGELDAAEPYLRQALQKLRRLVPPDSPALAGAEAQFGQFLLALGSPQAPAEAEALLRESLNIREKALPDGHPQTWLRYNTLSLLGSALAAQSEFARAEPLLLDGYQGMKDDPRLPPPGPGTGGRNPKREALERIVKLYEAWDAAEPGAGYAEKAAECRALLSPRRDDSEPAMP